MTVQAFEHVSKLGQVYQVVQLSDYQALQTRLETMRDCADSLLRAYLQRDDVLFDQMLKTIQQSG